MLTSFSNLLVCIHYTVITTNERQIRDQILIDFQTRLDLLLFFLFSLKHEFIRDLVGYIYECVTSVGSKYLHIYFI